MEARELQRVIELHRLWLVGDASGARANLAGADLSGANLAGADLTNAKLPHYQICPEKGGFTAWKAAGSVVLELRIPAAAGRVCSLVGRKIRVSQAKVVAAYDVDGSRIADRTDFPGWRNWQFVYRIDEVAVPDKFDDDIRVECTHGIHCFATFAEAAAWARK